jgi:SOS-response transcriptional repressor LexA
MIINRPLTQHEHDTWVFIQRFVDQFGYSPSPAEIQYAMGVSKRMVEKRLNQLEIKSWITRQRYKQRTIRAVYPDRRVA